MAVNETEDPTLGSQQADDGWLNSGSVMFFDRNLNRLYQQYYGRAPTPQERNSIYNVGTWRSGAAGWGAIEHEIQTAFALNTQGPVTPTSTNTNTNNNGGGGGGGGTGTSPFTQPWGGVWTPPTPGPGVPDTPQFHFDAPTYDEALHEPGYDFAAREGSRLMQQSAAAKGILNTGGSLRDLNAWGTNFATQNYAGVYGRKYQLAQDQFAPTMTAYATQAASNQRNNELGYSHAWDKYMFDYTAFRNWQNDAFDKYFKTANA